MLAFAVFSFNCYIFFWPITSWHCGIKSGKRCQCKAFCETDSAESRRMQDKFFLSAYSWNAFHISLIKHNVWNESHYSKKSLQTLCYISRSKLIRLIPATSIAGVPLGNSRILILCDVKKKLYGKRVAEAFRICRKFIESIIFDSRQFARLTKDMTSKMFQLSLSKAGKLNASRSLNLASFQNTLTIVGLPNIFGQCSVKTLTIAKMNCAKST